MATPRGIRGRQVEIALMANSGPGTPLQPVKIFTVTDITIDELGTEDNHEYVGQQGFVPDKDVGGHGGTFKVEMADFELSRLRESIVNRQYLNQAIQDIRLSVRYKLPEGPPFVRTETHREAILKFSVGVPSRTGFVITTVSWRAGGIPTYNER